MKREIERRGNLKDALEWVLAIMDEVMAEKRGEN